MVNDALEIIATQPRPADRSNGNIELLGQSVVAVIGNPEISRNNPNLPRVVWTVKALQQLADLMLVVKTPHELTDGRKEEFGFGGMGFLFSQEQAGGKETIVVDGWVPANASIPTGVAGKEMPPGFSAQMIDTAGTFNKFFVARGHDHHEVASNNPSGIDYRELTSDPMPVEIITRRSREPFLVALHRFDGQRFVNIGGVEVIDTGEPSTSQEDIARLVGQFGYGNADGTVTIIRGGRAETGSVQQMTTIRPGFGSGGGEIQIDVDGGDVVNIGEIVVPDKDTGEVEVDNGGSPQNGVVVVDEVDIAMADLEDNLAKAPVKKVGVLERTWKKITGQ